MNLFGATILLSAFLLFLVQPIIAKQILPWFGGTSAVWTTCLVFFQVLLLGGYAYAHFITRRLSSRGQSYLHVLLLAGSLALLPIVPNPAFAPRGGDDAALRIVALLATTVGLPYFLLSATGPLLQKWLAHRYPDSTVYRLFALSNFGSLIGLLAFPFAIEPFVSSHTQSYAWSAAYLVFALCCGIVAWQARTRAENKRAVRPPTIIDTTLLDANATFGTALQEDIAPPAAPGAADYLLWLVLAAIGSVLLLAATSHITQNIASVPFLWILPLTLYLLTFVLAFEGRGGRGWYQPTFLLWPILAIVVVMSWGLTAQRGVLDISLAVPLYCLGLFLACLFCHGELARRKPALPYLTHFYLTLAAGGALGGLFVALIAPRIFPAYYELPLALFALTAIATLLVWQSKVLILGAMLALGATAYFGWKYVDFLKDDVIAMQRNFYGVLRVREAGEGDNQVRRLVHGVILHGEQLTNSPKKLEPGSYYARTSGVGLAIAQMQEKLAPAPVKIGLIGLGVGTLSAYGRAGDTIRIYEIDPDVVTLAKNYFTYLGSTPAKIEYALGDARLSLERELAANSPMGYHVIAVDAFASDSIPVHLITREALAVYVQHLAPGGIIAVHISNRFLDLKPVLANIAAANGLTARLVADQPTEESGHSSTDWVLLSRDPAALGTGVLAERSEAIAPAPQFSLWTDQFNNLIDVLKSHPLIELKSLLHVE